MHEILTMTRDSFFSNDGRSLGEQAASIIC
jgi:hypothetical protein